MPPQPSVRGFFKSVSKSEHKEATIRQISAIMTPIQDPLQQNKTILERKRSINKEHQQLSRKRKREAEIQQGLRDSTGKRIRQARKPMQAPSSGGAMQVYSGTLADATNSGPRSQTSKRKSKPKPTNWQSPTLWPLINKAAHDKGFCARATVRHLQQKFHEEGHFINLKLSKSTVQNWITTRAESLGTTPVWKERVLERAEAGRSWVPGKGRVKLLDRHPEVLVIIVKALKATRAVGLPINSVIARHLSVGIIHSMALEHGRQRPCNMNSAGMRKE